MGDATDVDVVKLLLELKEHYRYVREHTYCRCTETSDCESCRADHYLEAQLSTVDDCLRLLHEKGLI